MDPSSKPWAGIADAVLSTFLLGGFWYSRAAFGRAWQKEVGLTDDQLGRGLSKVFGGAIVCAAIAALNLAAFIGKDRSFRFGLFAGAAAGIGWVATALVTTYLFERRSGRLMAIDAAYHVLAYSLMGAIIGAWPGATRAGRRSPRRHRPT
jgi:hypothetical protein